MGGSNSSRLSSGLTICLLYDFPRFGLFFVFLLLLIIRLVYLLLPVGFCAVLALGLLLFFVLLLPLSHMSRINESDKKMEFKERKYCGLVLRTTAMLAVFIFILFSLGCPFF